MKSIFNECIERIQRGKQRYRRYVAMLLVLSLCTTLGVNWGLHQNGIAATADYQCGHEEHQHDESCYTQTLVCTEDHEHSDDCYQQTLTCDKAEHTHSIECMIDTSADVEDASVWEKTIPTLSGVWADDLVAVAESQIGYEESTKNFQLADDGETKKGYSRYGAYYGSEYADWSTMFAAFCLNYAEIPTASVPVNSGCQAWKVDLENAGLYQSADYTPKAGDMALLNMDAESGTTADHVGIISNVETDETGALTKLTMVIGDNNDAVVKTTYSYNTAEYTITPENETDVAGTVVGYCALPEKPQDNNTNADADDTTDIAVDDKTADDTTDTTTDKPSQDEKTDEATDDDDNADNTVVDNNENKDADSTVEPSEEPSDNETASDDANKADDAENAADDKNAEDENKAEQEDSQKPTITTDGDTTTQTVNTENYTVAVSYDATAEIPDGAELKVVEYGTETDEYKNACEQTGETYDWLMDIAFYEDGEEIEPSSAIKLSVLTNSTVAEDEGTITKITHFVESGEPEVISGDDVEVTTAEDGQSAVNFELTSLSLVSGVNYRPATVVGSSGFSSSNSYLIYKVEGDYVYFLAYENDTAVTFRVDLANIVLESDTPNTTNTTNIGSTIYLNKDSNISGKIVTSSGRIYSSNKLYSELCWINENGKLRNESGGQYLVISGSQVYAESSSESINASTGSQSKYTSFSQTTVTGWVSDTNYMAFTTGNYFRGADWYDGYFVDLDYDFTLAKVGADFKQTDDGSGSTDEGSKKAVYTGQIESLPLGFYTVCLNSTNNTVQALPGVTYTIYDSNGDIAGTVTTTSDMRVDISQLNLPQGSYTMRMTRVPDGYVCDGDTWSFTLDGTDSQKTLSLKNGAGDLEGVILINPSANVDMEKTASVENYENRTYHVDLTAHSDLEEAKMDSLDINFVVDQSNSMLFPSGLKSVNRTVTVRNTDTSGNDSNKYKRKFDTISGLSTNQIYYIITEASTSSTVYALYYANGSWWYQDASYFAKAKYRDYEDRDNYIKTNDTIYLPSESNTNHKCKVNRANSASTGSHNGYGDGCHGGKCTSEFSAGIKAGTYTVYQAVDQYNRLHYLRQSLSEMLQMLAAMNPDTKVTLDLFTKTIDTTNDCITKTLNESGLQDLLKATQDITTAGGTRQDTALQHAYENHLQNSSAKKKYLILITDGAPMSSGKDGEVGYIKDIGTATDKADKSGTAYERINYWAEIIKNGGTKLATVGLGMRDVESGSKSMRYISTNGPSTSTTTTATSGEWWFQPENSSEITGILCDTILKQIVTATPKPTAQGQVTDYISDSFYPINPSTNKPVTSGTRIDKDGNVVSSGGIGTIYRDTDGSWYVVWDKTQVSEIETVTWYKGSTRYSSYYGNSYYDYSTGRTYTWQTHDGVTAYWCQDIDSTNGTFNGRVYLKAKEDFIGGNAINTNKSATLELYKADNTKIGTYEYVKPTVNVRLLEMDEYTSYVVVKQGGTINPDSSTPLDSMKAFYNQVKFEKIVKNSTGNVYNKVNAGEGCNADDFTLEYAIGELTEDEWNSLKTEGNTVTKQYTYNEQDGAVGYFTFQLVKEGVGDQQADWDSHTATTAKGKPNGKTSERNPYGDNYIEKYTLKITYTAYKLNEGGRPSQNVYNCDNGAGTEVGGSNASTTDVKQGKGTVDSTNIHYVYAYAEYALPSAGGVGTTPFTAAGVAVIGAALLSGHHLRRRRERRGE